MIEDKIVRWIKLTIGWILVALTCAIFDESIVIATLLWYLCFVKK